MWEIHKYVEPYWARAVIRQYFEQLYANEPDNPDEMENS